MKSRCLLSLFECRRLCDRKRYIISRRSNRIYAIIYFCLFIFLPILCLVDSTVTLVHCGVDKDNEFDVFISYSQSQKEIVCQIADRLKTEGLDEWIDIEKMCMYEFRLLPMLNAWRWIVDTVVSRKLQTLGVIGVVPTLPRIVCDAFRCQRGQNDAYVSLKLSPGETESGNRSVGTEIDPRYTTSYSTSVDNIGLSRAVWPKTKQTTSGLVESEIARIICTEVHYRQLGRYLERFGSVRTEL